MKQKKTVTPRILINPRCAEEYAWFQEREPGQFQQTVDLSQKRSTPTTQVGVDEITMAVAPHH